jgi:glycosyltransferase involved in cell wall biosynthesis
MFKIGFSNQATGRLFKDLVDDLVTSWFPSILYTGNSIENSSDHLKDKLVIQPFNIYDRRSNFRRLLSGLIYLKSFIFNAIKVEHKILLVVSNPPFIGLACLLLKYLTNQRYIMLVYDIYPDILIGIGKLSESSILVRFWRKYNQIVYENSDAVVTIGYSMKKTLEKQFDLSKIMISEITVIPNCADWNYVKPINKLNLFSEKYNIVEKFTIIYAGNFGNTHSFDSIINVAKKLMSHQKITFIFMGEGAQKEKINNRILNEKLPNILSLPLQPDETFPMALGSADVSLITMAIGSEKSMVPSKIYYSMAVGSALLGVGGRESELFRIINNHKCGINTKPDDEDSLYHAIIRLYENPDLLHKLKTNSFEAFNKNYTRQHMAKKYDSLMYKLLTVD